MLQEFRSLDSDGDREILWVVELHPVPLVAEDANLLLNRPEVHVRLVAGVAATVFSNSADPRSNQPPPSHPATPSAWGPDDFLYVGRLLSHFHPLVLPVVQPKSGVG